ncbi:MAG: threonine synthase, partial [Bacteroidota bacterium]
MKYYSTNRLSPEVDLRAAVTKGLAPDRGLYMPETISELDPVFFAQMGNLTFQEMAYRVAASFFGEDIPTEKLKEIVYETLIFNTP